MDVLWGREKDVLNLKGRGHGGKSEKKMSILMLSVVGALGAMVSVKVGFTANVAFDCIMEKLTRRLVGCVPKFPAVFALG
jgi:hypothetical protein